MSIFLVSNDDGIEAEGIRTLVKALAPLGKVYVTAPKVQQSAMGMALSMRREMQAEEASLPGAEAVWVIDGRPVDCVKYGLYRLAELELRPDFVFSGINMGANLGYDVHYSGTVAAAREGALNGIRSIALSVEDHDASHFKYICGMIPEILELSQEFDPETVLNVNTPNLPVWQIRGVKMAPAGGHNFDVVMEHEEGQEHSLRYRPVRLGNGAPGTDIEAVEQGYAVITPLTLSPTDRNALRQMNRIEDGKTLCVLVDYQEKLLPAMRKSSDLLENAAKFARCADRLDLPVILTQQYTRGLGPTVPEIRQAIRHYDRVEKLSFSCWDAPGFEDKIASAVSRKVVIAGIESHICVLQTALDFLRRGYEVTVLRDCCASRRKEDHEAAMEMLSKEGCTVTTWEAFVYRLLGSSTHTAFKAISAIVKE
ncbi:MAG: 5'/3'-nucleotidase SurE [Mogibacterium sp.]|nr:5'/3'-nucleotidase SurE [Mogibacterium sp.]